MKKHIVLDLLKYLLAFGVLALLVYQYWSPANGKGLGYVWQRHAVEGQPISWGFLGAGLAVYLVSVAVTLVRWYVLVRAQGLPLALSEALRLGMIGIFCNAFLPGAVGGDVIKAAALARKQARRTVAVATVIMDRVIALWGLFWFVAILGGVFWFCGALEGPGGGQARVIVQAAMTVVAVSAVVWALMGFLPDRRAERFAGRLTAIPRVGGTAAEFWRAAWMYRRRQGSVGLALVMSWLGFVGFVTSFYCCANALYDGDPSQPLPSYLNHFLIVPVGMIIMATPLFPGGAGIGELGFGLLYQWFGFAPASGVLGSLVQRVYSWALGLLGYLVYLWVPSSMPAEESPPAGKKSAPPVAFADPEHTAAAG